MDNFNNLRRSNHSATSLANSDKLKPYMLSSPVRIAGENVIASSSDYKKMSENLDIEFSNMRARNHFDSQSMINQDEIERLRANKSQTFLIKPDSDRVLERLFNEVYYRKENEGRAKTELDKIKQTIWNIDQNLATARELRMKSELGDLLLERECLAELERDLVQDIAWFKDMYDKRKKEEFLHPHRRVISEIETESQKIRDLRHRKEQIDFDRLRLSRNLEKIEKGDFKNIQRDVTDLLKETQAQKLKQQAFSLNPSDVKSLKAMITQGTEKVRVLRRDREELLKYGVMNKLELPKIHQEELNKKIERYLTEVERDCKTLQQRNDKLERFRDKISKYIDADGVIDPANHQKVSEILEDLHRKHRAAVYHMNHGGSVDQSNSPERSITNGLISGRHSISMRTTNRFQNSEDSTSPGYVELEYNRQTPEAKQLSEMRVQERELRKVLGVLPTESPAYRQKLLEIIQLTQVMGELEKIVEEQRLQKEWSSTSRRDEQQMKKEIGAKLRHAVYGVYAADQNPAFGSNVPLTDAQLRQNVSKRLRANVFGPEKPRFYERSAGFNITFDWVGGLPQKYIGCQIVYAVYTKGEMMASPKLINVHKCQYSQGILNKCTFNVTYTVFDVPPSMDALAIFEFQCLTDVDVGESDKPLVLGWSMIDLFDMMKAIKKGRWKIPIYTKPTDTHITFNRIKNLKRLKDLWFYLRVCIPSDESLANDQTKNPETLMLTYDIPEMHARYWNETTPLPDEYLENKPTQKSPVATIPAATQPREILDLINKQSYNEVLHKPKNLYKEIIKNIFYEDMFGDLSRIEDKPFNLAEELARDDAKDQANFDLLDKPRKETIPLDISVDYDYSKGLKLTILSLRNFKMCSRFQITGGLMDGDEFILDENAQDCVFGTKSKMLTDLFTYKIDRTLEEGSEIQNSVEDDRIPVETMIAFNEVFYFLRNIPGLILMKQNNLSINLVFQVIGIDEEGQPLRNKSTYDKYSKLRQSNEDEEDNSIPKQKQSPQSNFSFVCWYAIKLNRINGRIIEGRFIEPLYKPPMVKPPLENKEVQSTAARIEFIIEEYIYTANTLKEHKQKMQESSMNAIKKQFKPSPKKPVPAEKSDVFNQQIESDDLKQQFKDAMIKPVVQLTFKPFIENRKIQYTNRLFEKGSGIDIYIDAARFLPDNVTVSKVYFNVYTQDALPIIKAQHSISDLESNCFSPNFKLKVELRAAYFSPTCIAVLSIETIDRSNEEVRTIGYSAFNLFLGYHTNQPPISDAETDTILMEGCYQLPIFCQTPAITKPFSLNKMTNMDRIPCASLLVRVFQAPMTKDRMIVLSKAHVPETEWEQTGVLIPAPSYESGQYNTEFCMPTEAEMGLYLRRQRRQDVQIRARAIEMMTSEGYALERPDSEIIEWIEKKVIRTNATEALDMTYFAKYEPEMGFLVAVDGIHNPPDKLPYISICCLNPPGALFQHPPDPNQVCVNSELNWESPVTSPQFTEGWFSFTDINPRKNLNLIFEIRSVSFARNNVPTIKTVGWALLPVFNAYNYVQSGIYQIPVFRGALSRDLLDNITHNDAWQYLMDLMTTKKAGLAYLEPTSLVVRLADGQREGHFRTPFDYTRINYKYLPQAKTTQYVYNSAVEAKLKNTKKLSTIIPAKANPQEFNVKITSAINQELNLYS